MTDNREMPFADTRASKGSLRGSIAGAGKRTKLAEPEERIDRAIAVDNAVAETACHLRSIPGIFPIASAMPLAEMHEFGGVSGEQASALAGHARIR